MKYSQILKNADRYFEFYSEWRELSDSQKIETLWIVIGELLNQIKEDNPK